MTISTDPTIPLAEFDEGGVLVSRPAGVTCPACETELIIGGIESCKFAGCPVCHGMLFQQDVFAMLLRHLRGASKAVATPTPIDLDELKVKRSCCGCGLPLETHSFAGPGNAVIDSCTRCGLVWLDQGEFSKLVHAPGRR